MNLICRVWWPKTLSAPPSPSSSGSSSVLFGWFLHSSPPSSFLDIVVAPIVATFDKISNQPDVQGILRSTNGKMTQYLQEKSSFSILGQCVSDCDFHKPYQGDGVEDGPTHTSTSEHSFQSLSEERSKPQSCGCLKLAGFLEEHRQLSIRNSNWIQVSYGTLGCIRKGACWTPKLHHIHWGGHLVLSSDVHVITFDPPNFGAHHFSMKSWGSAEKVKTHVKSPMWVDKLYQKEPLPDLETVIFALNSATSAKVVFEGFMVPKSYILRFSLKSVLLSVVCYPTAVLVASFFTLVYIILQFFHRILSRGAQAPFYTAASNVFSHTWDNVCIRSCQLLYWPIRLQDSELRSQSNVEYTHRAALRRHSMWSSVAVDVLLGNIVGFLLLLHIDTICPWALNILHEITNNWLRSGCVWLMGVPAGFKLNTELAEILGMFSLNAIQIWSTLWIYVGFLFRCFIKGLAVSGIISGLTIPAALIIDVTMLATSHVSTLHWLVSFLYSHQIKSLAALWRLFRGRKWNPLRQRFDSYDYTVKQHVVGSLLFTPLLLLLPTTSVFYIFFTILNTTITSISIFLQLIISFLHTTPYHQIFLRIISPGRFPSGIWFNLKQESPTIPLLSLETNFASIGEILLPHYMDVFRGVRLFPGSGILTGKRVEVGVSTRTRLPSTMPWMCIGFKEYWCLCYNSLVSCLERG